MKYTEFEEWNDVFLRVILDLNVSYHNAIYLIDESLPSDERNVIDQGFFEHYLYQLKFLSTIQICKILVKNDNQKFNIFKIKNRIDNERIDDEFIKVLDKVSVNQENLKELFRNIITKINGYSNDISIILSARDKVYAHRDKDIRNIELPWDVIFRLTNLMNKLYNEINGMIYKSDMDFEMNDWSIKGIVKGCSR